MFFMDFLKKLLLTTVVIIGCFLGYKYFTRAPETPYVPPVTPSTVIDSIPVANTQGTTIEYVERKTGDNAQVELRTPAPTVVVRANDKEYTMPSTVKETSAFENGQLKIKQETTAKVDVTQVVNEQMEQERKQMKATHKREEYQKTFWGIVGGVTLGMLLNK